MSDTATWQEENTRTLSAAIARVRALLQRRAEGNETLPARTEPDKPDELGTWFRRRRKPALLRSSSRRDPYHHRRRRPAAFGLRPAALARNGDAAGNARRAAERLGLTRFELDTLLLCVAMELDTSIAALCARVQREPALLSELRAGAFPVR
jgi:hypothetical protein